MDRHEKEKNALRALLTVKVEEVIELKEEVQALRDENKKLKREVESARKVKKMLSILEEEDEVQEEIHEPRGLWKFLSWLSPSFWFSAPPTPPKPSRKRKHSETMKASVEREGSSTPGSVVEATTDQMKKMRLQSDSRDEDLEQGDGAGVLEEPTFEAFYDAEDGEEEVQWISGPSTSSSPRRSISATYSFPRPTTSRGSTRPYEKNKNPARALKDRTPTPRIFKPKLDRPMTVEDQSREQSEERMETPMNRVFTWANDGHT